MTTSKNVLFCLKNLGLAKERSHTSEDFFKHNDIVKESLSPQQRDEPRRRGSCRRKDGGREAYSEVL